MATHNRLAHWFSLIRRRLTLWIILILTLGLLLFILIGRSPCNVKD